MGAAASPAFDPYIGLKLKFCNDEFEFLEHPNAKDLLFAQEGASATIYQVANSTGARYCLKTFFADYRRPEVLDFCRNLNDLPKLPGLKVASRRVIEPDDRDAVQFKELHYALLMPWIDGLTWTTYLIRAMDSQKAVYSFEAAKQLVGSFLGVMTRLEANNLAHTDISMGNVIFGRSNGRSELVDLEGMYAPPINPIQRTIGTPPYGHWSAACTWRKSGDRYAASILAAEVLLLSSDRLATEIAEVEKGFFVGNKLLTEANEKFSKAKRFLQAKTPEFARVFEASWSADTLDDCPTIAQMAKALVSDGLQIDSGSETIALPRRDFPHGSPIIVNAPNLPFQWESTGGNDSPFSWNANVIDARSSKVADSKEPFSKSAGKDFRDSVDNGKLSDSQQAFPTASAKLDQSASPIWEVPRKAQPSQLQKTVAKKPNSLVKYILILAFLGAIAYAVIRFAL